MLFLIEDNVLIRRGMSLMLEQIKGIRIVGEASTGEEGLTLRLEKEPDVVILDFQLSDINYLIRVALSLPKNFMENELLPIRLPASRRMWIHY